MNTLDNSGRNEVGTNYAASTLSVPFHTALLAKDLITIRSTGGPSLFTHSVGPLLSRESSDLTRATVMPMHKYFLTGDWGWAVLGCDQILAYLFSNHYSTTINFVRFINLNSS